MSQERPMAEPGLPSARRSIPIRFDQIRRSPTLNIIGLPELIGLACAALLAILVVFSYFYFYLPAGIRLRNAEQQRQQLTAVLKSSNVALQQGMDTKESVD
ncbi:MAG TPA: hypothetical protein VKD91_08615, partial [Pyrinomonadaceae bacterium]|nr:hypothetical protein [Pyrinomonadaceae bacterium]